VDGLLGEGDHLIDGVALRMIPARGHSPNQMMVAGGGACFVADAVFAPEVAAKHGIPFYVDVDQTLATLAALPGLDGQYAAFIPGHGSAVREIAALAQENADRLTAIREAVSAATDASDDLGRIVQLTASRMGLAIPNPVIYLLIQTTVLACLSSLQATSGFQVSVSDNRLSWRQGHR
jgi:glyoxylase-like metal-dependent hydrolase (beta-lactamase superfamily II)